MNYIRLFEGQYGRPFFLQQDSLLTGFKTTLCMEFACLSHPAGLNVFAFYFFIYLLLVWLLNCCKLFLGFIVYSHSYL